MYSVVRDKELISKAIKVYNDYNDNVASARKLCVKYGLKETDYYRIKKDYILNNKKVTDK